MDEQKALLDNMGLVVKQAIKFHPTRLSSTEDYIQVGMIGLLKAIRTFNAAKNVKLSSYAWRVIYHEIVKEYQRARNFGGERVKHEELFLENSDDTVFNYIPEMSDEEKNLLYLRVSGYSLKEIAEHSHKPIHQINANLNKIYRKIRESNKEEGAVL